jgi:hypothetical protein
MINESNYKKILTQQIIINKDLICFFGTKKNIDTYEKTNKVNNSIKQILLNKASRFCLIEDIGKGQYKIKEIYKYPKPASFNKLNSGLYKYLSPIILSKLLTEHDENNKIVLPLMEYARYIEMVNQNYMPIKYNQEQASQKIEIDNVIIREFYEKVDDNIKYYIQRCLEYLQSADVLKWYKVPMIKKKKVNISMENNKPTFECEYENVRATSEEVKYFNDITESIRECLGIKSKSECFYGRKASEFCRMVSDRLSEQNISYFYDSYEIYYTNLNRCNNLLKEFKFYDNEKQLIKEFNEQFISYIVSNAESRQYKAEEIENEVHKYRLEDNYIASFKTLSELTIDNQQEKLKFNRNSQNDAINKMDSDFNITVVKKLNGRVITKEI